MKYDSVTKALDIKCFWFAEVQFFLTAADAQYVGSLVSGFND